MFSSSAFIPSFALLLSLPILFLIAPKILPPRPIPISLPDEIDDLSLFRKATDFRSRLGATNPRPKIAFMFLTNTDLQFAPLWEIYFANQSTNLYNIYIHSNPTIQITPPGGVFVDKFIPSKKTQRGSPSLISAARRLIATALLDDSTNTLFALISQHCIPLHSFQFTYQTLFPPTNFLQYKSFIEIKSKDALLYDRYNARGKGVMLPEVPFDRFRGGSQFFILNRRDAMIVVRDRRLWRKFRMSCLNTNSCYPEEHYFPTLLDMEDREGCSGYTLTNVNWTGTVNGHPYTYTGGEVSRELVERLRRSNFTESYLFARKFSPDCLKPLLDLAHDFIFKD